MIKHGKNTDPHFDPILVCGVVSRVQTALPSIRIRLRNLRPGFHPIYQKGRKCVLTVTFFRKAHSGIRLKPRRMPSRVKKAVDDYKLIGEIK